MRSGITRRRSLVSLEAFRCGNWFDGDDWDTLVLFEDADNRNENIQKKRLAAPMLSDRLINSGRPRQIPDGHPNTGRVRNLLTKPRWLPPCSGEAGVRLPCHFK